MLQLGMDRVEFQGHQVTKDGKHGHHLGECLCANLQGIYLSSFLSKQQ
jgi:hypothetical protein